VRLGGQGTDEGPQRELQLADVVVDPELAGLRGRDAEVDDDVAAERIRIGQKEVFESMNKS